MDAVRSEFKYKTFDNENEDKNKNQKDTASKNSVPERRKNGVKRRLEGRL